MSRGRESGRSPRPEPIPSMAPRCIDREDGAHLATMTEPDEDKKPFRDRLDELQDVVEQLERGDLDLEDAIQRFEAGQKLHKELMDELGSYEKRLEKLVDGPGDEGELVEVPDEESDDA